MALKPTSIWVRKAIRTEMKELGLSPLLPCKRPVSPSCTDLAKAVRHNGRVDATEERIVRGITKLADIRQDLYHVALLQWEHGLRISECLNIRHTDISPHGNIRITGLKGSRNRIIEAGKMEEWFLECRKKNIDPFGELDYDFVYRQYKKVGINTHFPGRKKASVTHAFRHLLVDDLRTITDSDEEIGKYIGHKNIKNTQGYGQTTRK